MPHAFDTNYFLSPKFMLSLFVFSADWASFNALNYKFKYIFIVHKQTLLQRIRL